VQRPAPKASGELSIHVGTAILLPNQQYPVEAPQAAAPETAPTSWTPWVLGVPQALRRLMPSIGDARWTPPALWDILGFGNCYDRWPNTGTNPHQGPVTKVAWGTSMQRTANMGSALRPTPSIPLPQPIIQPGFAIFGGIGSQGA
jgi:hypothetical protein